MGNAALVVAMIVGFQGLDNNSTPWSTYVSREGQFVVDFPKPPTSTSIKTENGPGGRMKVITAVCDSDSAEYIANKIIISASVRKGTEQSLLALFRDYYADLFHGKVVSEKRVRFEAKLPGLDFTLRVEPNPGENGTVRIRQYLSGQTIYALIALSVVNRDLPEDAGRFFGSFAIGTRRMKKSGPRPDVAGKNIPGWGEAIDADGDCRFAARGRALTIQVPAKLHDLNADIDKFNAPRVLRAVDGDFAVQVKVVGDFKPGPRSLNPKSVPFNGGGIFVWRDSDNYIRLERGAIVRNGKLGTFSIFEEREGGSRGAQHNGPLAPGTAYLRMERHGSRITGFTSNDGKRWTRLKPIDTVWPSELRVGIDAINSSNAPFTVRFEDFSLKTARRSASR